MKFKTLTGLLERARVFRKKPTSAEAKLWHALRNRALGGFKFRRQQPIDKYIVDFICFEAKLIVEVDGDSHLGQQEYDAERDRFLEALDLRVLRIHNEDVLTNIDAVKEKIFAAAKTLTPRT